MLKLCIIFGVVVILNFVTCFKPPDYCGPNYMRICKEYSFTFHMGCSNSNAKIGMPKALDAAERKLIIQYFNDIRNEIAGRKNISNMIELTWNEEYAYLAGKAVEQLHKSDKACYWTENSKVFPTDLNVAKTAVNVNFTWIIDTDSNVIVVPETFPEQLYLDDIDFKKLNKLNYLLDNERTAIKGSNYSLLDDPVSNFIGCSWNFKSNATSDFKQIRCIINARTQNNATHYEYGKSCTKCPLKMKCSKTFKHLCSSSVKFGISFWFVGCMTLLGFAKFLN